MRYFIEVQELWRVDEMKYTLQALVQMFGNFEEVKRQIKGAPFLLNYPSRPLRLKDVKERRDVD